MAKQRYEQSSLKLKMHEIIRNNFIGGFFWALGATVGLSIFFTVLSMIAKNLDLVPIVGSFASDVIDFILATNPNLHK